jgi:hypothetical protein
MKFHLHFLLLTLIASIISGCGLIDHDFPPTGKPGNSATPTPSSNNTRTPISPETLEPDLAKEAIQSLMKESEDCEAPCFWGIVPGHTSLKEATNIFSHLGLDLEYTNMQDNKKFYAVIFEFDNGLQITPILTVKDNWVNNISVSISPALQLSEGQPMWSVYSLDNLINRYGRPSDVRIFLGRGETPVYEMDVYFETRDLIVEYSSHDLRESFQICPLISDFSIVRLWFGSNPQNPPPPAVPLEKATSLTIDEFSELMVGEPAEACLNLNAELFP